MFIEMTSDEAQEFADWLRNRANHYLKRAEQIQHQGESPQSTVRSNGMTRYQRSPLAGAEKTGTVTKEQFEKSVAEKRGRVYDIARRLDVDQSVINNFMQQPDIKVTVGTRGWLKPKE